MATVGILKDTSKLKRLVDIIASRVSLYTVDQRVTMLNAAGLSFFVSKIDLSGDAQQFAHTLIRATEQRGTLPNQSYPSLVNLLVYLRNEILGESEDRNFVIELLQPWVNSVPQPPTSNTFDINLPTTPSVKITQPMKKTILFLAAQPDDQAMLRLDIESRKIGERLNEGNVRDHFELEKEFAVRPTDLSRILLTHKPAIVHFSGHGEKEGVVLVNNDNTSRVVSGTTLAGLFKIVHQLSPILCILFNCCWSEAQAHALKAISIPHIIGTDTVIPNSVAQSFAAGFYRGLGFGLDVPTAYELGKNETLLEIEDDEDWAQHFHLL